MASIEEKVEKLILTPVSELGYSIYDVEYVKEGKNYFLRIYIDKQDGIDLNDCEKVNNAITDILDEANYIKEQYFLEISSPGIERVLRKEKHLKNNIGNNIEIKLFKPINGEKQWIGTLKEYDTENITIQNDKELIKIPRKNIALIKTVYDW